MCMHSIGYYAAVPKSELSSYPPKIINLSEKKKKEISSAKSKKEAEKQPVGMFAHGAAVTGAGKG